LFREGKPFRVEGWDIFIEDYLAKLRQSLLNVIDCFFDRVDVAPSGSYVWAARPILFLTGPDGVEKVLSSVLRIGATELGILEECGRRLAQAAAVEHVASPDMALTFEPGRIVYKSHCAKLSGKPWLILRAIAQALCRQRTLGQLMDEFWPKEGNTSIEPVTVNMHISTARQALRNVLRKAGVETAGDPLPAVDRGTLLAWRLDLP
jgi:hypothetical protein